MEEYLAELNEVTTGDTIKDVVTVGRINAIQDLLKKLVENSRVDQKFTPRFIEQGSPRFPFEVSTYFISEPTPGEWRCEIEPGVVFGEFATSGASEPEYFQQVIPTFSGADLIPEWQFAANQEPPNAIVTDGDRIYLKTEWLGDELLVAEFVVSDVELPTTATFPGANILYRKLGDFALIGENLIFQQLWTGNPYLVRPRLRPFSIYQSGPNKIRVKSGQVQRSLIMEEPIWDGIGAFDTDYAVSGTKTLRLRVDTLVTGNDIYDDALKIGWDYDTPAYENIPTMEYGIEIYDNWGTYEVDVTETGMDGSVYYDVATVKEENGLITEVKQIIDYNPIIDRTTDVSILSGGSFS